MRQERMLRPGTQVTGISFSMSPKGPVLGHLDLGGQGRAADGVKVDPQHQMARRAGVAGDHAGAFQFNRLPLAVLKTEAVADKPLGLGHGQDRGGIQAAAEQDDCLLLVRTFRRLFRRWKKGNFAGDGDGLGTDLRLIGESAPPSLPPRQLVSA